MIPKITGILVIWLSFSCSSLIPVQNLSREALNGIGMFKEIGYNFHTACLEECTFSKVSQFEIEREENCACDTYLMADEEVNNLYFALMDYWEGLYQLSSMEMNQYNLNRPASTLAASNLIAFKEDQLLAFQKLSELSLKAVTGQYRKNRIKSYMKEADPYQQIISEKLVFVLKENLLGLMEIQNEAWYSFYKSMSYDPTLNTINKASAAREYYNILGEHKAQANQIKVLIEAIALISEEHHSLVASDFKFNSTNFKAEIGRMSKDLRTLHHAYEQFKK
ncbi:MAG: hypothetical protein GYB55_17200 [Cytophagales bacterium]|uniref:hypothetical protein n=1 Tax=Cyclobacterium marinum TaxID=104 RepID=UPI0030DD2631|nr:hypothetical protein [Cytophagales bacterium]